MTSRLPTNPPALREPTDAAPASARIAHVALWTRDVARLEALREFYVRWFGARAGEAYRSARRPGFVSYFLELGQGAALELMTLADDARGAAPDDARDPRAERPGWAHVALALGSPDAVDALTARLADAGVRVLSPPRRTGDGYYESVVADPDGNVVELTA